MRLGPAIALLWQNLSFNCVKIDPPVEPVERDGDLHQKGVLMIGPSFFLCIGSVCSIMPKRQYETPVNESSDHAFP
jgi:hypothetical protein